MWQQRALSPRIARRRRIDKKAELSQRRSRDAPNIWVLWKISRVPTMPRAIFPEICNGLLFRSILRMCVQNLKFVALYTVPEIIFETERLTVICRLETSMSFKVFILCYRNAVCYTEISQCNRNWNHRRDTAWNQNRSKRIGLCVMVQEVSH